MTPLEAKFNQLVQMNIQTFKQIANELGALKARVQALEGQVQSTGATLPREIEVIPSKPNVLPTDAEKEAIFYSGEED